MNHYSGLELLIYIVVKFLPSVVSCTPLSQGKVLRDMVWHLILELCPLGPYSKYQGYFIIVIHIYLIVNIIYYAPLYQYDYMHQLPFKGWTYGNLQP